MRMEFDSTSGGGAIFLNQSIQCYDTNHVDIKKSAISE